MPTVLILQVLKFVQEVAPSLTAVWRKIHADDPVKQAMTDAEAFADLIATGDAVGDKWDAYIRDNS